MDHLPMNVESPRSNVHYHDQAALMKQRKSLALLPLVAVIFYDVSGGPFGVEDAVQYGSPLVAVLGFLILPLAWSVPEALVTAELSTTFPENSGFVAWVTAAFGPRLGFLEGFMKWLSGVTDNAIYPVIFLTYLQQLLPVLESGLPRLAFLVFFSLVLTYLNYRGLHLVGNMAVAMAVFTLLPFVMLCIMGIPHVNPSNWFVSHWENVNWLKFFNIMFWNLNYWDTVSTVAGEVESPESTYPKALGIAVVLVVISYLAPLLVGVGVAASATDWGLGYFADIGILVGGRWLGWWIVVAAAVSQVGQFQAEMVTDSFQLLGMAERGFLPSLFKRRSVHGTPTAAIVCSSIGIIGMLSLNFMQIVELLNAVYCLAEILEFSAFLWLRYRYPSLHRPFKVPLSTVGCLIMLLPALVLLFTILILPIVVRDWQVVLFTAGTLAVGSFLYPLLQLARKKQWFQFDDYSPEDFSEHLASTYAPVVNERDNEEGIAQHSIP